MLRIFIATALFVIGSGAQGASPDLSEVCYQAAIEPPSLKITDRMLGYCTTAIESTAEPAARANLLNNRAILHLKRDNRMQARADLTEALRIDPNAAAAHITLAHVFWLEGNLSAAEESLSAAIRSGNVDRALIYRSIVRRTRGDQAGAMRDALTVAGYDEATIMQLAPEATAPALISESVPPDSPPPDAPALPALEPNDAPPSQDGAGADDAAADGAASDGADTDASVDDEVIDRD